VSSKFWVCGEERVNVDACFLNEVGAQAVGEVQGAVLFDLLRLAFFVSCVQ